MSEADEFCECGTEVDQIHCQVCGAKVCSLHDYNATIDMQQQRIVELEQEVERLKRGEDICGLCGAPGADKIPHPEHWPGERVPETELVHSECEQAECERAHALLSPEQREDYLFGIRK